jgi:hypothetical protein
MKILLEEMCLAAGVHIRLHTHIVGAAVDHGRLRLAVTESKSGREAFSGDVFIDATGDGDLAAFAGCGYDVGRPGSGEVQPMSMLILVTGLVPDEVALFTRGLAEPRGERDPKTRLLNEMKKAGVEPSYARPTLFWLRDDLFNMSINHQYNVSAGDAEGITQATLLSRAEVYRLVDGLRSLGGIWKNMRIVGTPEYIGVREGRRVHGRYTVTAEDLVSGAQFDDAVCRVTFPVDVHSTNPERDKGIMREGVRSKPYDIPFRSLIAKDVNGLLMAGRCISGDFIAHSSYRVTGDAVPMGEAAGMGAALAAKSGRLVQDVPWKEIAAILHSGS